MVSFGLFIELSDYYVEGLVHITELRNDYYHFDPVRHLLQGERSGLTYCAYTALRSPCQSGFGRKKDRPANG